MRPRDWASFTHTWAPWGKTGHPTREGTSRGQYRNPKPILLLFLHLLQRSFLLTWFLWGYNYSGTCGYSITKAYQHCSYLKKTSSHLWSHFSVETQHKHKCFFPSWDRRKILKNITWIIQFKVALYLALFGGFMVKHLFGSPWKSQTIYWLF